MCAFNFITDLRIYEQCCRAGAARTVAGLFCLEPELTFLISTFYSRPPVLRPTQCCGAGAGRSRYLLVGAGACVKVQLRLHLR